MHSFEPRTYSECTVKQNRVMTGKWNWNPSSVKAFKNTLPSPLCRNSFRSKCSYLSFPLFLPLVSRTMNCVCVPARKVGQHYASRRGSSTSILLDNFVYTYTCAGHTFNLSSLLSTVHRNATEDLSTATTVMLPLQYCCQGQPNLRCLLLKRHDASLYLHQCKLANSLRYTFFYF